MDEQNRLKGRRSPAGTPAIMPGAEPFFFPAGEIGCLLIHGFNGSPDGMRQMGAYLAAAGITALGVRLQGHGTDITEMDRCSYLDWVDSAEAGFRELGSRCRVIFVAGISMGGVIALHLAGLYPGRAAGVIALSTPYDIPMLIKRAVPVLKRVIKRISSSRPSTKDLSLKEVNYRQISLASTHQLIRLVDKAREGLPRVSCPVLLIASRYDSVVSAAHAPRILEALGSADKELIWVERSDHMITLDYDKEQVFQRSAEFIRGKASAMGSSIGKGRDTNEHT